MPQSALQHLRLLILVVSFPMLMISCGKEKNTSIFGSFKDPVDGAVYRTILIGQQEWLAENLNRGEMILSAESPSNNELIEKYCYEDDLRNCTRYGGLYTWDEMMDYSTESGAPGICPTGWWIPTDQDWKELEITLGMSHSEANLSGWRSLDVGEALKPGGTSYFGGELYGHRYFNGGFYSMNTLGSWWSSTSQDTRAWKRSLAEEEGGVYRVLSAKGYAYSVRCVRYADFPE
jgi:uncharacterized protein (TIGR02145 family)